MPEGIDTEYLDTLLKQCKCKVNGMIMELNKIDGPEGGKVLEINGKFVSIDYLEEKAHVLEQLLTTIQIDILTKSGSLRKLPN